MSKKNVGCRIVTGHKRPDKSLVARFQELPVANVGDCMNRCLLYTSAIQELGLSFGLFEYAKVGMPMLICGIIYFATIGYKFLPDKPQAEGAGTYDEAKDYSNVPKWKQTTSLIVLILTILAMIFEDKIGISLAISGCVGALELLSLIHISSLWNGLSMGHKVTQEEYARISVAEHEQILQAIEQHDAEAARKTMYRCV